jgi:hypothetical protein
MRWMRATPLQEANAARSTKTLLGIDATIRTYPNTIVYAPSEAGGIQYGSRFAGTQNRGTLYDKHCLSRRCGAGMRRG